MPACQTLPPPRLRVCMSRAEPGTKVRTLGVLRPGKVQRETTDRHLAIESPIAIEYNGIGYAVMMATPIDLKDFAIGFSLSERLIAHRDDIVDVTCVDTDQGHILRIQIGADRLAPVVERARQRVTESSCGLCGLESLEQVMRPLPPISAQTDVSHDAVFAALAALRDHQPLNAATGAAHGAAFCSPEGAILVVREDVGRHNALDKLIGALATAGLLPANGFFLLTARCSYELVEKTIIAGCPLLVTISAPTTLAADRAAAHGLALIALARADAILGVSGRLEP